MSVHTPTAPPGQTSARERTTLVVWLVVIAILELVLNRGVVPLLRPRGVPPRWFVVLDYGGLYAMYFATTLGVAYAAWHAWALWRGRASEGAPRFGVRLVVAGTLVGLAATVLWYLVAPGARAGVALDAALLMLVLALLVYVARPPVGQRRSLGATIGVAMYATPLLIHAVVVGWQTLEGVPYMAELGEVPVGDGLVLAQLGVIALCVAFLLSPYCFAPAPLSRSMLRLAPLLAAVVVGSAGLVLFKQSYADAVTLASLLAGIHLERTRVDPRVPLYLLSLATLTWTWWSTLAAPAPARRQIGIGLGLIFLGGHGFTWPLHYALLGLGMVQLVEGARVVHRQEVDPLGRAELPAISDEVWSTFVANLTTALRTTWPDLQVVSSRGDAAETTTTFVGTAQGVRMRLVMQRWAGAVLGVECTLGQRASEAAPPALVWAPRVRALAELERSGLALFANDEVHGAGALAKWHKSSEGRTDGQQPDWPLPVRAGWLSYWPDEALRWRLEPGLVDSASSPLAVDAMAGPRGKAAAAEAAPLVACLDALRASCAGKVARLVEEA